MNSIKILMALAAVCILAMPAFSMPDRGTGQMCQECKQNLCDCSKPMMEDKYQEDDQKPCDCTKPMMGPENGPIRVKIVKSMMGDRCQGDMPKIAIRSMMGNRCQDDRPMMVSENGPVRVKIVKSMMGDRCQGDRPNSCDFPRAVMGQDDDRNSCDCPRHAMADRC
jgi:hypothetical protein